MVAAIVIVAVISDAALWFLAPAPDPYAKFEKLRPQLNQYIRTEYPRDYSVTTRTEEGLSGMKQEGRFTTNNMGFRGQALESPKPKGEYRVFLVGGSSAECFYLDDEDDMCAVAERELNANNPPGCNVRVYNVGLSGTASDDHVAMITQRLVHLEPDAIIVFCGLNDLTRSIYDYDYLHYIEEKPAYRKPWYKRVLLVSQIARRLYFLRQRIDPSDRNVLEERTLESDYAGKIGLQRTIPVSDIAPKVDVRSYERNLATLVGVAQTHDFELVFMTHPSTWNSPVDPEAKRWSWMRYRNGVHYREDAMDAALEELNDSMRRLEGDHRVPLFDAARTVPKSLDYFYDDCHLNVHGAATVGRDLARFLQKHGLVSVPAGDGTEH
jgi:lysophospholipase L1-like esterase